MSFKTWRPARSTFTRHLQQVRHHLRHRSQTSILASAHVTLKDDFSVCTEAKGQVSSASPIKPADMVRCYAVNFHKNKSRALALDASRQQCTIRAINSQPHRALDMLAYHIVVKLSADVALGAMCAPSEPSEVSSV